MKLGRFVAMGAAGAMVLSMSACNTPGTAAVVAGQRITTGEVTRATEGWNAATQRIAAARGRQVDALPESVTLNVLTRARAAESLAGPQAAALRGKADLLLADPEFLPAELAEDEAARPFARAVATQQVQAQAMGQEAFEQGLRKVKTTLNPRYGLRDLSMVQPDPQTGAPMLQSQSLSNVG